MRNYFKLPLLALALAMPNTTWRSLRWPSLNSKVKLKFK